MTRRTMWAPWRMEYIRGPKARGGCIFCDYPAEPAASHRERLVLCVRPQAFVILNRYPFSAGHLMVVPRRHVSDLDALTREEYAALFDLVREATTVLRDACNAQGVNVGINLGAAAGAGIAEHLHVHVVPRWPGDLNFMPVIGDVSVMPEALDATYARLAPHFAALTSLAATAVARPRAAAKPARRPRGAAAASATSTTPRRGVRR